MNTQSSYEPFTDNEWNSVLYDLWDGLNYKWEVNTSEPLTTLPLSDFIQNGPAMVVIATESSSDFLSSRGYTGRGFFPSASFPKLEEYANTNDFDQMRENQYDLFVHYSEQRNKPDQVFVLSWFMTLQGGDNINPVDHITVRADYANNRIAQISGQPPYQSPFLWSASLPNIIMIDNVRENKYLAALSLGFNRYFSTC